MPKVSATHLEESKLANSGEASPISKNAFENSEKLKKPSNPYMLFCASKRAELKSQNPKITVGEIMKRLGKLWQ